MDDTESQELIIHIDRRGPYSLKDVELLNGPTDAAYTTSTGRTTCMEVSYCSTPARRRSRISRRAFRNIGVVQRITTRDAFKSMLAIFAAARLLTIRLGVAERLLG